MNEHSPIQLRPGAVDNSLGDIVTTFRLSTATLEDLPDWIKTSLPTYDEGRIHSLAATRAPFYGKNFLGSIKYPVQKIWAPKLSTHLAEIGIVPQAFEIKIKGLKRDDVVYRLKIFWSREKTEDSEARCAETQQLKALFDTLQHQYSWDVVGAEFARKRFGRRILLSFRGRSNTAPSMRYGDLGIKDHVITLNPDN